MGPPGASSLPQVVFSLRSATTQCSPRNRSLPMLLLASMHISAATTRGTTFAAVRALYQTKALQRTSSL